MKEHEKINKENADTKKSDSSIESTSDTQVIPVSDTKRTEQSVVVEAVQPDGDSAKRSEGEAAVQQQNESTQESGYQRQQPRTYERSARTRTTSGEYRRPERRGYQSSYQHRPQSERAEVVQPTLEEMTVPELNQQARRLGIVGAELMKKADLLEKIKFVETHPDLEMQLPGCLKNCRMALDFCVQRITIMFLGLTMFMFHPHRFGDLGFARGIWLRE